MSNAENMGQMKDTVAKLYLQNTELVADLFNAFIFKGKRKLTADMLKPFPTEENSVLENADGIKRAENLRRDASYLAYTDGKALFYLCLEVQSGADWTMPVRVMRYDAAQYQYQIETSKVQSQGRAKSKLLPVFTLVLNFGKGPWKGPHSLYEMLDNIDEDTRDVISNYRINIVDPYVLGQKTLDMLCTEIKHVLTYFRASRDAEGFDDFLRSNSEVSLSEKAILVLNTYLQTKLEPQIKERTTKMCVAWKNFEEKTLARGRAEGMAEGRAEGMAENQRKIIWNALKVKLDYSTIQSITGLSLEEIKEIAASANAK